MHLFLNFFLSLFIFPIFSMADDGPLIPSQYLNIDNASIAVYESSGVQEPSIFLIHGNTSSANAFARFMRSAFAAQYRVVAIDLPGYGKSSNLNQYNAAAFKSIISQAAIQLGVDDGVMVGWSLGGDYILQSSTLLPNAQGYVIFGTAPVGGAPATAPPSFLTPLESYAGAATLYGFIPFLLHFQIRNYVDAFFSPQYPSVPYMLYQDGYRTDPNTRAAVALLGVGLDSTFQDEVPLLQSLQVPVAILHAENDAFVRLAYLQAIESSLPTLWQNQIVIVPGSGHAIQWEKVDEFSQLLEDFINDL
jgi:pimeloyl-ACP methyl ester carboxylesterase